MRINIDASSIIPGRSAGVEAFAYGLIGGLTSLPGHDLEVTIVRGTGADWSQRIRETLPAGAAHDDPGSTLRWSEVALPLAGTTGFGGRLRRALPASVRSSRLARRAVTAVRHRAAPAVTDDVPTLYPFHRVPVRASRPIVTLHDLRGFQPQFRSPADMEVVRDNVARAAAVIVSWPHPYRQALETFPEARDKIALIPLPAFHAHRPEAPAIDRDPGLLLYPSSTAAHKNHATLVSAMSLLPDLRLACPGPLVQPAAGALAAQVDAAGLGGRVSFPGFVSNTQLEQLFARAAAVVVPSLWEAASGAVFEAFSWGVPVACADVAPLRAQVEFAGGEVCFFDPASPEATASAIRRLLADREHYAAQSRRAGARLAARSWTETARDYADVVAWVADGRPGPMPRSSFVAGVAP